MFVSAIFYLLLSTFQAVTFALATPGSATSFKKAPGSTPNSTNTLLVNTIVGKQNASSVECWAVEPGFQISPTTGNNILQLGSLSNASYSQWPNTGGPIDLGFHNAPAIQWVVMLAGSANITFPDPTTPNLTVFPGELFIAADVAGTSTNGHSTVGDSGSIVLQMPFQDGTVVNHTVVDDRGPCN
ncbi:hypothetical protein GYMLUDRAFT_507972 [Collybiopsis luxurians FD-317 M1]|nr:hypothetical protein GYMLUDRAFT_507972 [Collybiopsis luxurians FD-317 M1]